MSRLLLLSLSAALLGCASAATPLLGAPYLPQTTLSSPFCRAARCPDAKPVLMGDKFADESELFRVYRYPLNIAGTGITLAELTARTRPDGRLDILKFEFLVPIRPGIQAARPILNDWLRLAGLPASTAQACLQTLDRASTAELKGLPSTLEGSCTAENGRAGYRIIRFAVGLKDTL